MTFDAFQRHLTTDHRSASTGRPFGQHAAGDYPSRLRRMELLLQAPLENAPPMILRSLAEGLRQDPRVIARVSPKVMGDLARALREYADFLDNPAKGANTVSRAALISLGSDAIVAALRGEGFIAEPTKSKQIIELSCNNLTLYLRLDAYQPLIIHPLFEEYYSMLSGLSETISDGRVLFYHSSNLLKFPMRDNSRGLIHYGIAFGFVSAAALRNFTKELQNTLVLASPMAPERGLKDEMEEV